MNLANTRVRYRLLTWLRLIGPATSPGRKDGIWIGGTPAAAVVPTERHEQVASLHVEVMAQNDRAVSQVGRHRKKMTRFAVADDARPKRHHLHQPARSRDRDRVLAKVALDLNQRKYELPIEAGALGLVVKRLQEFHARRVVAHFVAEPL